MLMNQHTLLFTDDNHLIRDMNAGAPPAPPGSPSGSGHEIGAIDPEARILPIVEHAFGNAKFLSEQFYLTGGPDLVVKARYHR